MSDSFALLHEPRRPWIDADALRQRFLALSTPLHPDRVHGAPEADRLEANARYAALNAAHNTLREPRDRLFHLLELELGSRPRDIQRLPAGTMELFVEIGQACRDADQFLAAKPAAPPPMIALGHMRRAMEWTDTLFALQARVDQRRAAVDLELRSMNAAWETAPDDPEARRRGLPLERLEELTREISYVTRWTEQLRERIARLAE